MVKLPRVLLLNPPSDLYSHKLTRASFPLGICYIGTYLKKNGYEVKVIDTFFEDASHQPLAEKNKVRIGMTPEKISKHIMDFAPDVLGISCNFYTHFYSAMDVAELAKTKCRVPYVVLGGSYASVVPERLMSSAFIDYVVIGEGEKVFDRLLKSVSDGSNVDKLNEIDGLVYRDHQGKIQINPKKSFMSPEEIVIPDRDLLPVENYIQFQRPHNVLTKRKRVLEVMTSRGCQMHCSFCSAAGLWGSFKPYKVDMVIQELTLLKEKYGIEEVQFLDDNLTADRKRAQEIFQGMIDKGLKLSWCTPNGLAIYTLDEPLIRLMEQSGCYMVILALETGSPRVAKELIHKPIPFNKLPMIINAFRKNRIDVQVYLLVGIPQETFEEIRETFNFVFKLGILKAHFNYIMPIPNTKIYEQYIKSKTEKLGLNQTYDWRVELNYDFKVPVLSTPLWSTDELKKFVDRQLMQFYLKFLLLKPFIFFREVGKIILQNPSLFLELLVFYKAFMFEKFSLSKKGKANNSKTD